MRKDNLQTRIPSFEYGEFKWYVAPGLQKYIETQQTSNKPALDNIACFIVTSDEEPVYVLIDDKQSVLAEYRYTLEGYGQMEAMITMMKIYKHFENDDVQ